MAKLAMSERIGNRELFTERYMKHKEAGEQAAAAGLTPTAYFYEALEYHERARLLQNMNLGLIIRASTGDALQDNVPIYDTIERRYAGFSNVLEQLWYGEESPKFERTKDYLASRGFPTGPIGRAMTTKQWLYLCAAHRVTGSGASFMADHGWRNTIIPDMAAAIHEGGLKASLGVLRSKYESGPIFTSLGNQIPSFNKPSKPQWRTGGIEYLHDVLPKVVSDMVDWLELQTSPVSIQVAVDYALGLNTKYGWRRFKFVLTAWVLDIAEYYPTLVDPMSDCYHGKNAIETMTLIFDKDKSKVKGQKFLDLGTRFLATWSNTTTGDVEDVFCDVVRWVENFIPKKNYEHLDHDRIWNSSAIKHPAGRQPK